MSRKGGDLLSFYPNVKKPSVDKNLRQTIGSKSMLQKFDEKMRSDAQ